MTFQGGWVVYRKELTDILRDRRTLMSMILFPILIIPVFYLGVGAFMQNRMAALQEKRSTIAWIGAPDVALSLRASVDALGIVDVVDNLTDTLNAMQMLRDKEIHGVVVLPHDFDGGLAAVLGQQEGAKLPEVAVYYDQTRRTSDIAFGRINRACENFRAGLVSAELERRGLRSDIIHPFAVQRVNIATPEQMGRFVTGFFLPYIVILMIATGAMYPSIDLTAGEKERGTLETLLAAGVARGGIVLGKFLTVLTAAIVTAVLAIASLMVTFTQGLRMFEEARKALSLQLDPTILWILAFAILPLAVIFSAMMMTLGLFAKSYREAQTYISPIMILIILPAMASLIPDAELNVKLALIPILNVSLALKEGFAGTLRPEMLLLTMGVNFLFAAGALLLMAKMFRREKVLFRT